MKIVLILLLAASSVICIDDEDVWLEYLKKFQIRFRRSSEIPDIKDRVLRRYRSNLEHNKRFQEGQESFEVDLNQFSYLSEEDLKTSYLGLSENGTNSGEVPDITRTGRNTLPEYFNWVDQGIIRPVQNQGSCGSCYAFAAIGAIEANGCRYLGQCSKLSEQEAMECTALCAGGWDDAVYKYTQTYSGCTSSAYKYYGYRVSQCSAAGVRSRVPKTRVKTWYNLTGQREDVIRNYLVNQGPMFMTFYVYNNFFQYKSGIYASATGGIAGGHAVLLVGYGTENGVPYWILKNSWGSGWGENGYFRIKRGSDLARIESYRVSVPIVE